MVKKEVPSKTREKKTVYGLKTLKTFKTFQLRNEQPCYDAHQFDLNMHDFFQKDILISVTTKNQSKRGDLFEDMGLNPKINSIIKHRRYILM